MTRGSLHVSRDIGSQPDSFTANAIMDRFRGIAWEPKPYQPPAVATVTTVRRRRLADS
jgi:hypothetical protein